jgi:type IV pilus assembly protein PilO
MAIMPQGGKQQRAALAVVALVVGFYAYWTYVRAPAEAELGATRARLERLVSANRNAQITAARGGQNLEEQTALYERHVRALEELVPASEEVPQLLRDLTMQTRALGVDLNLIEPQPDQPGEFYTKESYTLRVIGEYHNVGRFLTAVASLPRIITPVNLQMSRLQPTPQTALLGYRAPVQATFRIETYVLPMSADPGADVGEGVGG